MRVLLSFEYIILKVEKGTMRRMNCIKDDLEAEKLGEKDIIIPTDPK